MGRTKLWTEQMQARFAQGTFEWIESALEEGEDRTDFVREAVVRELQRRLKLPDAAGGHQGVRFRPAQRRASGADRDMRGVRRPASSTMASAALICRSRVIGTG